MAREQIRKLELAHRELEARDREIKELIQKVAYLEAVKERLALAPESPPLELQN